MSLFKFHSYLNVNAKSNFLVGCAVLSAYLNHFFIKPSYQKGCETDCSYRTGAAVVAVSAISFLACILTPFYRSYSEQAMENARQLAAKNLSDVEMGERNVSLLGSSSANRSSRCESLCNAVADTALCMFLLQYGIGALAAGIVFTMGISTATACTAAFWTANVNLGWQLVAIGKAFREMCLNSAAVGHLDSQEQPQSDAYSSLANDR